MMLNDGDEIIIRGRKATVCYNTKYNGEDYICVAFESDKIEYDIYKYKIEGEKLLVSNELSQDEIKNVLCIFVKEGLDEYGLPKEMYGIIDEAKKIIDNSQSS